MEREQIVNAVRDWLDNDDWRYEYDAENDLIHMGLSLSSKLKSCKIFIFFAENCYTVYHVAEISGDPENLTELNKYLTKANYGLRNGNFELDYNDGETRHKTFVNCKGLDNLPSEIIMDSIFTGAAMLERYGDGIAALSLGFSDADTEIEKAEMPIDSNSDEDSEE